MKNSLAIAAVASCFAAACPAAVPLAVPESLLACAKLQDAGERVRCYDAQVAAMKQSTSATSAPPVAAAPLPRSTPAPAVPSPASPAGAANDSAPAVPAAAAPGQPSAAQYGEEDLPHSARPASTRKDVALHSSIASVRTVGQKIYLISLSNGQVWRQEGSQIPIFFHVGDEVSIERGALGSYRLSTAQAGAKNWVRVTRLR